MRSVDRLVRQFDCQRSDCVCHLLRSQIYDVSRRHCNNLFVQGTGKLYLILYSCLDGYLDTCNYAVTVSLVIWITDVIY